MQIRSLRAEDLEQAWELDRYAFHSAPEKRDLYMHWDPARLTGAFENGRLLATVGAHPFGQFFGGRSVPMAGLSGVAVVPDRRGQGIASRVIWVALESMRDRGEAISSLFPTTASLYRKSGYEVGGAYLLRRISADALRNLPRPASGRVRPAALDEINALRDCYAGLARGVNGFLDRSDLWWRLLALVWKQRKIYVAESDRGEVEGYLVYRQIEGEDSAFGGAFSIGVDDLVATTRDAGLGLWRLLGSWTSQAEFITYPCGPEDSALLLMPEQKARVLVEVRWMTRIVDATAAVDARGFPQGLEGQAHLEILDPILPSHAGRFVLTLSKGRGRLEPGGQGRVRLGVGPFSSLYTGWASTGLLARTGHLEASHQTDCAILDAAFAGPVPWIHDEF